MIGMWSGFADEFLTYLSAATFLFFAVPLTLTPLKWARFMGFQIPSHTDLAVYFGRSVGGLVTAINVTAFRAGRSGEGVETALGLIVGIAVMMFFVHVWGAIKKIQPLSETLEIGFWIALGFTALAVWPV